MAGSATNGTARGRIHARSGGARAAGIETEAAVVEEVEEGRESAITAERKGIKAATARWETGGAGAVVEGAVEEEAAGAVAAVAAGAAAAAETTMTTGRGARVASMNTHRINTEFAFSLALTLELGNLEPR